MKTTHMLKPITALLLVMFVLGACDLFPIFEKRDRTFDGDPQVEFKPIESTRNEGSGTTSVAVQLIGPQRESDLSVNFSVNSDGTTAQSGVHYNLVSSSPVTIAANSSSTVIEIDILADSMPGDETRTLVLTLEGGGGVEAAANFDTYTLTIRGVE